MKKIIVIILALWVGFANAQTRVQSFDFGGTSAACGGSDQIVMSYPSRYVLGGGVPPTGAFSIVGAAMDVWTNDPDARSFVGQLGQGGDGLIGHMHGDGRNGGLYPAGIVVPNSNTTSSEIHFHVLCTAGHFANVWLTIWYTQP